MKKREKCRRLWAVALAAAGFLLLNPGRPAQAGESESITLISQIMFGPKEAYVPKERYEERGRLYRLKSWELEDITVKPRSRRVEQEVLFEDVEAMAPVPDTYEITAKEDFSGLEVQKRCPALRIKKRGERWAEDFSFPIVFHSYGAEFYLLGDVKVPADTEAPWLDGCEEALLKEIGGTTENYRIMGTRWEGAPYLDENHEFCRDAAAWGKRRVADYLVTYGGTVTFPEVEGFRCRAVYQSAEPEREETEGGKVTEEQEIEIEAEDKGEAGFRWSVWREAVVITVSILLALALIILFLWLIRRLRKLGKKGGERRMVQKGGKDSGKERER